MLVNKFYRYTVSTGTSGENSTGQGISPSEEDKNKHVVKNDDLATGSSVIGWKPVTLGGEWSLM